MKHVDFRRIALLTSAVGALFVCGCSDDKVETVVEYVDKPTYIGAPNLYDRTVEAGDSGVFDFTAADKWTFASDAEWLTLSATEGEAGEAHVTYTVSDSGLAFDTEAKARLTFVSLGKEFYCTLTRAAKTRQFSFTDGNAEVKAAVVKEVESGNYQSRIFVTANCDWELKEVPSWIETETAAGTADLQQEIVLTLATANLSTTGMEGELLFASGENFTVALPVKFYGAEPTAVYCDLPEALQFSPEAYLYDAAGNATDQNEVKFNVTSIEDGYKLIVVTKSSYGEAWQQMDLTNEYYAWMTLTERPQADDNTRAAFCTTEYTLSLKENTQGAYSYDDPADRWAWIFVLPGNIYAKLYKVDAVSYPEDAYTLLYQKYDEDYNLIQWINPELEQYLMCRIDQKAPRSFIVECDSETFEYDEEAEHATWVGEVSAEAHRFTLNVTLPKSKSNYFPANEDGDTVWFVSDEGEAVDFGCTMQNSDQVSGLTFDLEFDLPANTTGAAITGSLYFKYWSGIFAEIRITQKAN